MRTVEAAEHIVAAWRDPSRPVGALPEALRPADASEGYAIQAAVAQALGPVGGWKVGSPAPDGPCSCAPMPRSGMQAAPARFSSPPLTLRVIESEIAFRFDRDLPPRGRDYGRDEVLAAIGSCHPALEVLQSRFADPDGLDEATRLADLLSHGGFALGEPIAEWQAIDFAALRVSQLVDGAVDREGVGNPAGDMLRLMVWLANEGARPLGGLKAGQVVTCGSWTGKSAVGAQARVSVRFEGAPVLDASFGA